MTHSIGVLLPAPNNEHFLTAMKQRLRLANWIEGSTVNSRYGRLLPET